jgi:UTP--glucose-1-phosphate uridylyltransferase
MVKSKIPFAKQLVEEHKKHGCPVIGVQKVPEADVEKYGIVKLREGTNEMEDIIEKPKREEAPSQLAQFGRMILTPAIVDILKNTPLGKGQELWITDAIRTYVRNGGKVVVKEVEGGEWLTTGDPLNFLKTTIEYAFDRPDIGEEFKSYLKDKFANGR